MWHNLHLHEVYIKFLGKLEETHDNLGILFLKHFLHIALHEARVLHLNEPQAPDSDFPLSFPFNHWYVC